MMKYCNKRVPAKVGMDSRLRGNDRKSRSELFAEKLHKAMLIAQLKLEHRKAGK